MSFTRKQKRNKAKLLKREYKKYSRLEQSPERIIKGLDILWKTNPDLAFAMTEEFLKKVKSADDKGIFEDILRDIPERGDKCE